jgi:NAD(P)H-hydrate epimerase
LLSRAQIRAHDAALIAAGVPGVVLMENAGRGAAEVIHALAIERGITRATVLAGPGNNGGDGFVVARHLRNVGFEVAVFAIDADALGGDAAVMRDAWKAIGGAIHSIPMDASSDALFVEGLASDLVVDALFGTGLSRPLAGPALCAIRTVNLRTDRPLAVALDSPSGLDADTGAALGGEDMVFRATHTLTFAFAKPGLHTGFGVVACGDVSTIGIGARIDAFDPDAPRMDVVRRAPVGSRRADAHKGDNGRVVVIGGSAGTTGAALLTARGAHRAGAGLVTIASRSAQTIEPRVVETMTLALGHDVQSATDALRDAVARADAVCVGPGLGRDDWARAIVEFVLARASRAVLDADGLTLLATLAPLASSATRVLTPHPLEMARLLGRPDAASVNADRVRAARECATRYDAIAVLKGAGTVIANASGRVAIVDCAEPSLGVAGSGDVLAGVIAARLAEHGDDDVFERVVQAVVAHGRAGHIVRGAQGGTRGALASEIADAVSGVIENVRG